MKVNGPKILPNLQASGDVLCRYQVNPLTFRRFPGQYQLLYSLQWFPFSQPQQVSLAATVRRAKSSSNYLASLFNCPLRPTALLALPAGLPPHLLDFGNGGQVVNMPVELLLSLQVPANPALQPIQGAAQVKVKAGRKFKASQPTDG